MSPVDRCQIAGYVVIGLVLSPFLWWFVRDRWSSIRHRTAEGAGPAPLAAFRLPPRKWRRFLWLEFLRHARESATMFLWVFGLSIVLAILMAPVIAWIGGATSIPFITLCVVATGGGAGLVVAIIPLTLKLLSGWHLTPARKAAVTIHPTGIAIAGRLVRWSGAGALLRQASVSHDRDLLTLHIDHLRSGVEGLLWEETVLRVPLPHGVDATHLLSKLTPYLRQPPSEHAGHVGPTASATESR